jgi:hypothetical protein
MEDFEDIVKSEYPVWQVNNVRPSPEFLKLSVKNKNDFEVRWIRYSDIEQVIPLQNGQCFVIMASGKKLYVRETAEFVLGIKVEEKKDQND